MKEKALTENAKLVDGDSHVEIPASISTFKAGEENSSKFEGSLVGETRPPKLNPVSVIVSQLNQTKKSTAKERSVNDPGA